MDMEYLALNLIGYAIKKRDGDPIKTFSSKPQKVSCSWM